MEETKPIAVWFNEEDLKKFLKIRKQKITVREFKDYVKDSFRDQLDKDWAKLTTA